MQSKGTFLALYLYLTLGLGLSRTQAIHHTVDVGYYALAAQNHSKSLRVLAFLH